LPVFFIAYLLIQNRALQVQAQGRAPVPVRPPVVPPDVIMLVNAIVYYLTAMAVSVAVPLVCVAITMTVILRILESVMVVALIRPHVLR
jgi:hypothetical protein